MMKSIALLSLLVVGSLTGCEDEEGGGGFGSFLMNGELTGAVEVDLGASVSLEFVPGNELVDIHYKWSAPSGGTVTQDDSRLASFTATMPGSFTVYCVVTGRDPMGQTVVRETGLLIFVKQAERRWMAGVIESVTFDGVARPHGGTSSYAAGQSIDIIVDEADGVINTDVQAEVSAGEIIRRGYNQFRWNLPATPGADAMLDITTLGRLSNLDVGEAYSHLIRLE